MPITSSNPFKGAISPSEVILVCVRWYLRYPLAYEHVAELLAERGVEWTPVASGAGCRPTHPSSTNAAAHILEALKKEGVLPCAWRIHEITQQSASGTTRDSASASHTRQVLSATQVR